MKRGYTLVELMVVIALIGIMSVGVAGYISNANAKTETVVIDTDKETLKSAVVTYEQDTSKVPVLAQDVNGKSYLLTKDQNLDTINFVDTLYEIVFGHAINRTSMNTTEETTFNERFKWIDVETLIASKKLTTIPKDDRYIIDTETDLVFHVTDDKETLDLYSSLLSALSFTTTTSIDDMSVRTFKLKTSSNTYMTTLYTAINVNGTLFVGGTSTATAKCYFAKITLTDTGASVQDLTHLLSSPKVVTSITQELGGIKVYYSTTSYQYKTIVFPTL